MFAILLVALVGLGVSTPLSYNNHFVVSVRVTTPEQEKVIELLGLDVWGQHGEEWDIRLESKIQFAALQNIGMEPVVKIANVQELIEKERVKAKSTGNTQLDWFTEFHRYDEIVAWYQQMASSVSFATFIPSIGKSYEGRDIAAVRLKVMTTPNPPKLYFQAGLHAREWASPATVAYQMYQLCTGYGNNTAATKILNNFEVVIIPVTNPDGYEFSWDSDRMWRKNRRVNTGSSCRGTDLNRNWDSQGWCEVGASTNPCSDTYCGTRPFSEPETTASSNFFNEVGNVVGAIDFHAYGRYVLRPYGYPITPTADETVLKQIGDDTANEIESVYRTNWSSMRSAGLYPAAGGTEDWMYDSTDGFSFAFCFELRGNSFILPTDEIIPSGEEIWAGLAVWSDGLLARFN